MNKKQALKAVIVTLFLMVVWPCLAMSQKTYQTDLSYDMGYHVAKLKKDFLTHYGLDSQAYIMGFVAAWQNHTLSVAMQVTLKAVESDHIRLKTAADIKRVSYVIGYSELQSVLKQHPHFTQAYNLARFKEGFLDAMHGLKEPKTVAAHVNQAIVVNHLSNKRLSYTLAYALAKYKLQPALEKQHITTQCFITGLRATDGHRALSQLEQKKINYVKMVTTSGISIAQKNNYCVAYGYWFRQDFINVYVAKVHVDRATFFRGIVDGLNHVPLQPDNKAVVQYNKKIIQSQS